MGMLSTYQRMGENKSWDTFREKVPERLLELYEKMLVECRRNGFIYPRVEGGELIKGEKGTLEFIGGRLVFQQVITTDDRSGDLCTFCDRICARRDNLNDGTIKEIKEMNKENSSGREPQPCWAKP